MRRFVLAVAALVAGCDDELHGFQAAKVAVGAACTGARGTATYTSVPSGTAPSSMANAYAALLGGGDSLAVGLGVGETHTGTCALTGGSSDVVAQVKSQSLGTFEMPKHGSVTYDAGTGLVAASSASVTIAGFDPAGNGTLCGSIDATFDAGTLSIDFTATVYCRQNDD